MPRTPLRISREPLLTSDQLEAIESTAIAILEDVGVMVGPQRLIDTMQAKGFTIRGDRVVFEPSVVREFLDAERAKPVTTPDIVSELTLGVSQYSRNYLDPETGEIQPYTTQSLIEAARIVDGLASRGVRAGAPGTPVDVHPELESVSVYHTSLTHTRHGMHPPDPRSVTAQRYLMEMADCVGYAMPLLPVYVNSPLCLAGESLDSVLAFEDRLESTWMVSMPTAGATAPIRTGETFALSAAEVIGSAIVMREATDLEIGWGVQGFPFDMRQVSIVYGSPENLLMQFMANEVDAYLHGTTALSGASNIHTMAKLP